MTLLYIPFLLVTVLMGYDEVLHHQRGLGAWEKLGHPIDTLTVFAPLSYITLNEYSYHRLIIYTILAAFSCLVITKDEFIHTQECKAVENWVHSMLFILHPIVFAASAIIWKYHPDDDFLIVQSISVGVFMIYQVIRWSFSWKERSR